MAPSTDSTQSPQPAEPQPGQAPDTARAHSPTGIESPAERGHRLRIGGLLTVLAAVSVLLATLTKSGDANFQMISGEMDKAMISVPAAVTAWVAALIAAAAAGAYLVRRIPARYGGVVGSVGGVAFMLAVLCWAAAGQVFPLANQIQGTIAFGTPLVLGALSGVLCERAGVINIAIEGQFLAGAFCAAVVASLARNSGMPALYGLLGAMLSGMLIAALLAICAIRYQVNQIVLGVVLIVFATGLTGFGFDEFLDGENSDKANSPDVMVPIGVPGLSKIPIIGPMLFEQTALTYLTVLAVVVVAVALYKTRWGLRVRSVGEHPLAADTVGVKVRRIRYQAVLAGGALAGLGGAYFTIGSAGAFQKLTSGGQGFIALAALIMGRWHPVGATVAAIFFGFTTQLQSQFQIIETPIPSQLWLMVPYLATILAVAGLVGRVRAPKADGEPYTGKG